MNIGLKVTSADIDLYGHADYSSYLNWYKKGHQDLLESVGLEFNSLEKKYGLRTVVRHADIEYLEQLFVDDDICINTLISKINQTSMCYTQYIEKENNKVSKAKITVVFINEQNRPINIPEKVRGDLKGTARIAEGNSQH